MREKLLDPLVVLDSDRLVHIFITRRHKSAEITEQNYRVLHFTEVKLSDRVNQNVEERKQLGSVRRIPFSSRIIVQQCIWVGFKGLGSCSDQF